MEKGWKILFLLLRMHFFFYEPSCLWKILSAASCDFHTWGVWPEAFFACFLHSSCIPPRYELGTQFPQVGFLDSLASITFMWCLVFSELYDLAKPDCKNQWIQNREQNRIAKEILHPVLFIRKFDFFSSLHK